MSSSAGISASSNARKDPGWKYNYLRDPSNTNEVICNFCGFLSKGGIFRAKQHQVGNSRNVKSCSKCPPEVLEELKSYIDEKKELKMKTTSEHGYLPSDIDMCDIGDDIEEEDITKSVFPRKMNKRLKGEAPQRKGPMDLFVMQKPGVGKMKQQNIINVCDKEARDRTIQYIAKFFYQAGIPFNAAKLDSFKWMLEAVGRHGPNLKPPTYHELRVPLLKNELNYTNDLMKDHRECWAKHGCSIMSDGWTEWKSRTLVNFLVNCSKGTMFIESVDASSYANTGERLFELLDGVVEKVGEKNVVQIITDNGSNFVLAGKLLQAKRKHIYWTPCVAHCIDLMLEDIGKIPQIKRTLEQGIFLVGFIYNHTTVLNIMRTFTEKKELVRYGITRFATTFLTLQRLHKLKSFLRKMFISNEWVELKLSKQAKGKRANAIVLKASFWNLVLYTLKVMGPLVIVLRLVDNEKKPTMGYIYEAIDRAKETIHKSFQNKEEKYRDIFEIIDRRWESQMHHPLHAASHFLNPQYFYCNHEIGHSTEVVDGLYHCIKRLTPIIEIQDIIYRELSYYKNAEVQFALATAVRSRSTISPAEWWGLFGTHTPKLQQLAIKVLSLTYSASGCERNWSTFEGIHTKKRNRLEHKKLLDLVYVKYNQKLKARFDFCDTIDPAVLDNIDASNEWLIGEMDQELNAGDDLVFEGDGLTWGDVERATGVGEPMTTTKEQARALTNTSRSLFVGEENETALEETDDEIEGGYSEGEDASLDGEDEMDDDDLYL